MRAKISVSELSQDLASILDRVHRRGDSFLIERDGETLAALEPVPGVATWSSLAGALRDTPDPDPSFASDLEGIQRNQPGVPINAWPS